MAAGIEVFGPDHEVAVEIVPLDEDLSLLEALSYENSIHRSQVAHCYEMVSARRAWWDDVIFEDYPTWEEAVEDRLGYFGSRTDKNIRPVLEKLEDWFGEDNDGLGGPGNYGKSYAYGIGKYALAKMLKLYTSEVEEALRSLPLTPRARRGLELRSQEDLEDAEFFRQEAERLADDPSPEAQAIKKKAEDNAKMANARATRDQEDYNANFLIMLEIWEAALQFCASPQFFVI